MADIQAQWQTPDRVAPPVEAFHIETVIDPFTRQPCVGMVRHAGHACVLPRPSDDDGQGLAPWQALGIAYLKALQQALQRQPGTADWLPSAVWQALTDPPHDPRPDMLRWLPITWGGAAPQGALRADHACGSFWVDRRQGGGVTDRSLVLLAGCSQHGLVLGSDMGLRITMHLRGNVVHVHGVTFSGLGGARAAAPRLPASVNDSEALFDLVNALRQPIGQALGQGKPIDQGPYPGVWIRGLDQALEPGAPPHRLRISGLVRRAPPQGSRLPDVAKQAPAKAAPPRRARIHDFAVDVDVRSPHDLQVVAVHRNEFAGSAMATEALMVFLADGASQSADGSADPAHVVDAGIAARRTTRPEAVLQALRRPLDLALDGAEGLRRHTARGQACDNPLGLLHEVRGPRSEPTVLEADTVVIDTAAVVQAQAAVSQARAQAQAQVQAMAKSKRGSRSRARTLAAAQSSGQAAAAEDPVFWTDAQAAVEAYARATELFDRFDAYGIDPHVYFRFARLPLVQRARAALQWVPEGDMPSAEVRPFLGDGDLTEKQDPDGASSRPQLLVKYGSADPMHRRLLPVEGPDGVWRSRAQYLGVASDPRWAWHEFGHVLNFASTGELEFPFAHSAGDALGAIVSDPLSALAPADDPEHPLRFVSFPWIEVPGRLHGRRALEGYCWCGRRNLLRLHVSASLERHHHGYFEEQLLSSSLFRIYRSLGGDTGGHRADGPADARDPDTRTRLDASDWCVYLVMRAIALLGPDSVAPARSADQFVSALIDADLGTGAWTAAATWPKAGGDRSVQRQGGQSHKVIRWAFERQGLYATDQPDATVDGFGQPPAVDVFVADRRPLDGPDGHPGGYAPVPLRWSTDPAPWHAADGTVRVDAKSRRLLVQVRNRGLQPATGLRLRAWWADDGAALNWTKPQDATTGEVLAALDAQPLVVPVASPRPAKAGAGWLLVALDADADPANLAEGDAPPQDPLALLRLVAADNNLALCRIPA